MTYQRGDYVKLAFDYYDVYVVASDDPSMYEHHDTECWIVAVHDNDWNAVGTNVSTCYVNRHNPTLLYRED